MIDVLIQGRLHAALPPPVQYDTDKRRAARRTALEISRRIP